MLQQQMEKLKGALVGKTVREVQLDQRSGRIQIILEDSSVAMLGAEADARGAAVEFSVETEGPLPESEQGMFFKVLGAENIPLAVAQIEDGRVP